jgi:hypothetical protein
MSPQETSLARAGALLETHGLDSTPLLVLLQTQHPQHLDGLAPWPDRYCVAEQLPVRRHLRGV